MHNNYISLPTPSSSTRALRIHMFTVRAGWSSAAAVKDACAEEKSPRWKHAILDTRQNLREGDDENCPQPNNLRWRTLDDGEPARSRCRAPRRDRRRLRPLRTGSACCRRWSGARGHGRWIRRRLSPRHADAHHRTCTVAWLTRRTATNTSLILPVLLLPRTQRRVHPRPLPTGRVTGHGPMRQALTSV